MLTVKNAMAITASLRTSGIEVLDFRWDAVTVPASAAWNLSGSSGADGRDDAVILFGDPDLVANANAAWWRLAEGGGLFGDDRDFLVSVGPEDGEVPARPHWARVRLMDEWDVIGAGTDHGVLGGPPGRPGFVMMSLDERLLIGATTWDGFLSIMTLPDPGTTAPIRRGMGLPY
ncbi:hypothetical protein [Actinoplanes sp. NPDC020271]|uniref:hypothetical protein n=1 Tax=Actinoplanes sp. NPDC020271 TaxID=3363896 RepID=UPI0037B17371